MREHNTLSVCESGVFIQFKPWTSQTLYVVSTHSNIQSLHWAAQTKVLCQSKLLLWSAPIWLNINPQLVLRVFIADDKHVCLCVHVCRHWNMLPKNLCTDSHTLEVNGEWVSVRERAAKCNHKVSYSHKIYLTCVRVFYCISVTSFTMLWNSIKLKFFVFL